MYDEANDDEKEEGVELVQGECGGKKNQIIKISFIKFMGKYVSVRYKFKNE